MPVKSSPNNRANAEACRGILKTSNDIIAGNCREWLILNFFANEIMKTIPKHEQMQACKGILKTSNDIIAENG